MKRTYIILLLFVFILISGCTQNCDTQEKDINQLIDSKNYCEQDSDCILLNGDYYGGCPFGCINLVNKNENFESIRDSVINYREKNCPKSDCMYDCGDSPKQEEIKCIDNKCVDIRQ